LLKKDPWSQGKMNEIFKISPSDINCLISRESSFLEFKESFGFKSLASYLKTSAAYANTKGGYIVFGVANTPHKLIGLLGANLQQFGELDPELITKYFNEYFSPEVKWDCREYELNGKTFGLLYIYEAENKPVMCKKNAGNELKEGDIYYRYRGRTERIKYPELRDILEKTRQEEQQQWMRHFQRIARIGVREAEILDFNSGKLSSSQGTYVIDESLLSQISFIKEGSFSETKGGPTLRVVGNVEAIAGLTDVTKRNRVIKTKGIRTSDIVLDFLNLVTVEDPSEYVQQICFESSAFLPVYYYIQQAGLSTAEALVEIDKVISRFKSKSKLIERLSSGRLQYHPIRNTRTAACSQKQNFAAQIKKEQLVKDVNEEELVYCLQAIRGLLVEEIESHSQFVRGLLKYWFNKYYNVAKGAIVDELRRAICWVDEALYGGEELYDRISI
jgi:hypothetical protein